MGGLVLSLSRMNALAVEADGIVAQPGVTLTDLDDVLAPRGRWYPPAPTFLGATVGGVIATNAAGAATFKYGTTRDWVDALTVVLGTGDVLDLRRGTVRAHPEGYFDVVLGDRTVRLDVPSYRWPDVPKVSCGYYAAAGMDLVDLFIGAEGTLGVVTSATLRTAPRPAMVLALVLCASRSAGLDLVTRLRAAAGRGGSRPPNGPDLDVSAVEHMDRRCLELLREDGVDVRCHVDLPAECELALLVTLELPLETDRDQAFDQMARALEVDVPDTSLVRFCRTLAEMQLLDRTEIALPGDRRQAAFVALREAVPAAVNARVARAQHVIASTIDKMAADVIVPFDRLSELLVRFDEEFRVRDLDGAVWGHVSDGNLHANVIPRRATDATAGKAAILSFGRCAIALGGSPCAEHGVGRNAIKQQLARELLGAEGIEAMRRLKRGLDPRGVLAPGVLGL